MDTGFIGWIVRGFFLAIGLKMLQHLPVALARMVVRAIRLKFGGAVTRAGTDVVTRAYVYMDDRRYEALPSNIAGQVSRALDAAFGRTPGRRAFNAAILYVLGALLLLGYHEEGYRHSIDITLYLVFVRFPVVLLPVWVCGLVLFVLQVALATRTVKVVVVSATASRYLGALAVLTALAYSFAWAGAYVGASAEISEPAFLNHHLMAGWRLFTSGLSFEWRNALTAPWASTYSIDKFPLTWLTNLGLVPAMLAALTLLVPLSLQTVLTVARTPILRVLDRLSRHKDSWFVRFLMFVESLLH